MSMVLGSTVGLPPVGLAEVEDCRRKLLDVYCEALGKALEVVEGMQSAIDRLVEMDGLIVGYMVDVDEVGEVKLT